MGDRYDDRNFGAQEHSDYADSDSGNDCNDNDDGSQGDYSDDE